MNDPHALVESLLAAKLYLSPQIAGDQLYFISNRTGHMSLFSMPLAGGVEVLVEVRRWSPDTKVVVLTGVSAVGLVSELIEAGVDGLFSKASANEEMYEKLPNILRGRRHIAKQFLDILEENPKAVILTDRERQTLNLIIRGRSNKEIAEGLGISVKTVDKHRTSLMQKLKVHSVPQLMARALKEGMIDASLEL